MQAIVPLAAPVRHLQRRARTLRPRCGATSAGGFKVERAPAEDARQRAACAFHLAIPVADLAASRRFYGELLGFPEGRSAPRWIDFNAFGHQLVCHLVDGYAASTAQNAVDGDPVPVPHFGAALPVPQFHALAERLRAAGVAFELEPHLRFRGAPGEQWCMFLRDPSGNALEFKAVRPFSRCQCLDLRVPVSRALTRQVSAALRADERARQPVRAVHCGIAVLYSNAAPPAKAARRCFAATAA